MDCNTEEMRVLCWSNAGGKEYGDASATNRTETDFASSDLPENVQRGVGIRMLVLIKSIIAICKTVFLYILYNKYHKREEYIRIRTGHKLPETTEAPRGIFLDTAKPLTIHHLLSDPYYLQHRVMYDQNFQPALPAVSLPSTALRKGMGIVICNNAALFVDSV